MCPGDRLAKEAWRGTTGLSFFDETVLYISTMKLRTVVVTLYEFIHR